MSDNLPVPLPPTLAEVFAPRGRPADSTGATALEVRGNAIRGMNRSLLFDRGFSGYAPRWRIEGDSKKSFLSDFARRFGEPADYPAAVARRRQALASLDVVSQTLATQTRLVVGLGLPHPTETGFLLDRLTGCPYLPGSSLKGLLRAAARLVASGELESAEATDVAFWKGSRDRLFGPERTAAVHAAGELVVYDAFPTEWPSLDVDILTPHHSDYYGSAESDTPPADWHEPVPVAFLTVVPGTSYRFSFGHRRPETRDADLEAVLRLLPVALDWLGIGGKTSAGYGVFGKGKPRVAGPVPESPSRPQPQRWSSRGPRSRPPEPTLSLPQPTTVATSTTTWENNTLEIERGTPTVRRGNKVATCTRRQLNRLETGLYERVKKSKALKVDVKVSKTSGQQGYRIIDILKIHD